jgi:UPF0042 nucleotide-binding protein
MASASPHILILTGLSGSGKTSAVKAFEDLGYFCVDNLPIHLIPPFVELCRASAETLRRAVIVIDIRERQFLPDFPRLYDELRRQGTNVRIIFFEASPEVLLRRFSETRRPHPLADAETDLPTAIAREREALQEIRARADLIIDTSEHTVHTLRRYVIERFGTADALLEMTVTLLSFGFKHGVPPGLDLLFDVRFLPNPHFVPELRPLSGQDARVIDFMRAHPDTMETIAHLENLLRFLLPRYQREGRSYVTIGIGCTGGRHRSVMIVEELARVLRREGYKLRVTHRDIDKL